MNKEFFKTRIEEVNKQIKKSGEDAINDNSSCIYGHDTDMNINKQKVLEESQQAVKEALLKMKSKIEDYFRDFVFQKEDRIKEIINKIAKEDLGIDLEEKK